MSEPESAPKSASSGEPSGQPKSLNLPRLFLGVAIASAVVGSLWGWFAPGTVPTQVLTPDEPTDSLPPILSRRGLDRPVTIALLGVDRLPELDADSPNRFESHTDTVGLMRFDPQARSLYLVSIPRDTRVEIPGHGTAKLNQANRIGGRDLVVATLENLFEGLSVDRAIRVDVAAARQAIDRLGGLELYVEEPMQYVDRAQNLTIDLEPGWQLLNGAQVLDFSRYRADGLGDVGRVQRQQLVFDALRDRLSHPSIIAELPAILAIVSDAIDANLTTPELLALTQSAIAAEDIRAVLLPGRFAPIEAGDTSGDWIPDPDELDRIASQFLATTTQGDFISAPGARTQVATADWRIAVQNATGEPVPVDRLDRRLKDLPEVRAIARLAPSDTPRRRTQVLAQSGDLAAARRVRDAIGCGSVVARSTGAIGSDVTILLGQDCAAQWRELPEIPDVTHSQRAN
ncbi:MAG: LCP family protein [Geitlerinemataceae cyanobacterium]